MSWPTEKLGNVAEVVTGSTPSKKIAKYYGDVVPFITPSELNESEIREPKVFLSNLGAKVARILPAESVLVCCIGSLGKIGFTSEEVATNQQINSLIFDKNKVFPRYGYHCCKRLKPILEHIAPSTTIAIVNKSRFSELEIPLPPIKEQKRIAAILDKADAIRRKRQQAIDLTDQLLRSVFLDMFGDPVTNPKGWDILPLSTLVSSLEGGKNVKPDESGNETTNRILKVSAVTSGRFKATESKPLPDDFNPPDYYYVRKGDLLISRANTAELIGATAFVHEFQENLILPDKIWRMKWANSNCVHPLYVHYLFQQASIRREISIRSSGTSGSMKNIPKPKLLEIPIPIPSTDEQKKFGEIAEKIYSTHNLFGGYEESVNDLFNSLTQQAFNGELSKQTKAA